MNGFRGDTVHVICSIESVTSNKKNKEIKLKEIIASICALINSNGGSVVLDIDSQGSSGKYLSSSPVSTVIRTLEQTMISIIGIQLTVSNMHFKKDKESIVIFAKNADSVITTNYNLYLPSQTQVVLVSTLESVQNIINRKIVLQVVPLYSHQKIFVKGENCDLQESKIIQLKCLKSDTSKRTTLADRITGKGNKFSCYVSAFANLKGGHIYYGINDDGVVEGQVISSDEDKSEITKKVGKAINKMIWPEQIGQPKREEHWEIFFEPVLDENSKPIQSTFVIVIYIAPCLGGVFAEEPECYEMAEGKVGKMSFATWKKRILVPDQSSSFESSVTDERHTQNPCTCGKGAFMNFTNSTVDSSPQKTRSRWSSDEAKQICTYASNELMESINNGMWKEFHRKAKLIEEKFPRNDVKLIVLSKTVIATSRRSHFNKARATLNQFYQMIPQEKDKPYFVALASYLEIVLKRNQKCFQNIEELLKVALSNTEEIEIGFLTAAIFTLSATVSSFTGEESGLPLDECCRKALDHLQRVQEPNPATRDMTQKALITLALFHLKCVLSKELIFTEGCLDTANLEKAKSALATLNKFTQENPTSRYREIQHKLAQSVLYYRQSQVKEKDKVQFLESAINFAEQAKTLAEKLNFEEMVWWSKAVIKFCTEELVRLALDSEFRSPECSLVN